MSKASIWWDGGSIAMHCLRRMQRVFQRTEEMSQTRPMPTLPYYLPAKNHVGIQSASNMNASLVCRVDDPCKDLSTNTSVTQLGLQKFSDVLVCYQIWCGWFRIQLAVLKWCWRCENKTRWCPWCWWSSTNGDATCQMLKYILSRECNHHLRFFGRVSPNLVIMWGLMGSG